MTPAQLEILKAELANDPLALGYAPHLPHSPGLVVALLAKADRSIAKSRMISERGILAAYPGGPVAADIVLAKLETFSVTAHPLAAVTKRVLKFAAQPDGFDIGDPATQAMLNEFGVADVLTVAEASNLMTLAQQPASRAEELGLPPVTEQDLRNAGVI